MALCDGVPAAVGNLPAMGTSPLQRKIALKSGGSHGATKLSELRQVKFVEAYNRFYN
jgi:hypothetical protein